MKPRALLRPGQLAWLAEIGLDTHWLAERPASDGARVSPAARAESGDPAGPAPGLVRVRAPADCPDLQALGQAVSACSRCERHAHRALAVSGSGTAGQPYYLIVGEQPGIEDDASGQPFQGDQGRLLAAMLAAARLPHADSAYLTYAVKCRAVGGREPPPADVAACLPWLQQQIALLQPRWILALGRVAARAVIGSDADLDELRGGPHRYVPDQGEPIPVWVTHQPSSLLVRSAWKAEAWRDLAGLAQAVRESRKA